MFLVELRVLHPCNSSNRQWGILTSIPLSVFYNFCHLWSTSSVQRVTSLNVCGIFLKINCSDQCVILADLNSFCGFILKYTNREIKINMNKIPTCCTCMFFYYHIQCQRLRFYWSLTSIICPVTEKMDLNGEVFALATFLLGNGGMIIWTADSYMAFGTSILGFPIIVVCVTFLLV